METCIDYTDREWAVISSDEPKWHRRMRQLMQEYPDKVRIKNEPETNDGCIVAVFPANWVKIKPKKALSLTDEQIAARTKNLQNSRKIIENSRETEQTEGEDEEDE